MVEVVVVGPGVVVENEPINNVIGIVSKRQE